MLKKMTLNSIPCIFFFQIESMDKLPKMQKLHAHLQYVQNNCARFEECQPNGVQAEGLERVEINYTK
jgi:hypothetical protein